MAGALASLPGDCRVLDCAGCAHLPSRQPTYQAAAILGVVARVSSARAPRGGDARRSVHEATHHGTSRQDWFLAVVHVFHVAKQPIRDSGVPRGAGALSGRGLLTAKPVAEYAGHLARDAATWREASLHLSSRARVDAVFELRHLWAAVRARGPRRQGARLGGVPRFREVRGPSLESRRPDHTASATPHDQRGTTSTSSTAAESNAALPRRQQRPADRVLQDGSAERPRRAGNRYRDRGRQHGPDRGPVWNRLPRPRRPRNWRIGVLRRP